MSAVEVDLFSAGTCSQIEALTQRGGAWRTITFPATVALIRHAGGLLLFDTGYAPRYYTATDPFPQRLYRWLVPVQVSTGQDARSQLARRGITADQIGQVVISHLHADHIGGLADFANARIVMSQEVDLHHAAPGCRPHHHRAFTTTSHGVLPELLPSDLLQRRAPAEHYPAVETGLDGIDVGYDLVGDGSVIAVPLPGHAPGHLGLWLPRTQTRPVLLIGDAAWLGTAISQRQLPPAPVVAASACDPGAYRNSVEALAQVARQRPEIMIVPSHCERSLARAQADLASRR